MPKKIRPLNQAELDQFRTRAARATHPEAFETAEVDRLLATIDHLQSIVAVLQEQTLQSGAAPPDSGPLRLRYLPPTGQGQFGPQGYASRDDRFVSGRLYLVREGRRYGVGWATEYHYGWNITGRYTLRGATGPGG